MNNWLSYEKESGLLTWKRGKQAGKIAGSIAKSGHLTIRLEGQLLLAHRIIWQMITGRRVPDGMVIDHINGNPADNRWSNLRLATKAENAFNSRQQNRALYKGIYFDKSRKNYQAYITANRKRIRLGRFATLEGAVAAVKKAREELHGKFARHGYAP